MWWVRTSVVQTQLSLYVLFCLLFDRAAAFRNRPPQTRRRRIDLFSCSILLSFILARLKVELIRISIVDDQTNTSGTYLIAIIKFRVLVVPSLIGQCPDFVDGSLRRPK